MYIYTVMPWETWPWDKRTLQICSELDFVGTVLANAQMTQGFGFGLVTCNWFFPWAVLLLKKLEI